jgi:hemolysin activation/secretion protein
MRNTTAAGGWASTLALVPALVLGLWGSPAAAQSEPRRVPVTDISVLGNTLLPQATVDAALAPYKGERTLDELKQAAAALQDLYRQAGYGAVVTFLPEQAVSGGRLVIGVLEGRVAKVAVIGNKQFSADNVRRAVPALQEGQTPRVRRIDAQVQLANENPARRLALTLEPGAERGQVDAALNLTESPVSSWQLFGDNTGSRQTGRARLGLGWRHANLWDRDHQLLIQAQTSPESPSDVRIFGATYRVPLPRLGTMVSAYGTYSNVNAGTTPTPAGALQFSGRGRAYGVAATRLFDRVGEVEQRLSLALERRDYLNACAIAGLPEGACGSAGESVTVHPLTLEYSVQRTGARSGGASISVSHNLDLGGRRADNTAAVRTGAPRGFTVLRASGQLGTALPGEWQLQGRVAAQYTGDALIPGEQFNLAGSTAVRGYEERELTGDSGVLASVELLTPNLLGPADARPADSWLAGGTLRLVAFADGGTARNELDTPCRDTESRCTLTAVGVGARLILRSTQWRLDIGHPLDDGRLTQRGGTRVHVQGSISFP